MAHSRKLSTSLLESGNIQTAADVRCHTRVPSDVRIDVAGRQDAPCSGAVSSSASVSFLQKRQSIARRITNFELGRRVIKAGQNVGRQISIHHQITDEIMQPVNMKSYASIRVDEGT
jgi:hypothetical protein